MLTIELRTMDMKEIIELWGTDKKKLKLKLLDDYHMLAKEFRTQNKIYTQESNKEAKIWNKYRTCETLNYQAELDIDKPLKGTIKFTKDFVDNIEIALEVKKELLCAIKAQEAYILLEAIRLKALEVVDTLELLHVKVPYVKDFEKRDKWLEDDLFELKMQEIEEAKAREQEIKEYAEYIIEEVANCEY